MGGGERARSGSRAAIERCVGCEDVGIKLDADEDVTGTDEDAEDIDGDAADIDGDTADIDEDAADIDARENSVARPG